MREFVFTNAHCRPLDKTIAMIELYDNVFCDTAFVPEDNLKAISLRGLEHKIIFGTDFPVTHYFRERKVTLTEQYAEDVMNGMKAFKKDIDRFEPKEENHGRF